MLRIIRGGFYGAGRARLKSMISDLVERGERTYLIVPEQQTVMAEAEMTRELSDSAPMYFEATNFTRLANTTFRTLGGVSGEYCTKTKKALPITEPNCICANTLGRAINIKDGPAPKVAGLPPEKANTAGMIIKPAKKAIPVSKNSI